MPSTNLEKIYISHYRSFNFQQLFFYDISLRNAYFTSYRYDDSIMMLLLWDILSV